MKVVIHDPILKRASWPVGTVIKTFVDETDPKKLVRDVTIRTEKGTLINRSTKHVVPLMAISDDGVVDDPAFDPFNYSLGPKIFETSPPKNRSASDQPSTAQESGANQDGQDADSIKPISKQSTSCFISRHAHVAEATRLSKMAQYAADFPTSANFSSQVLEELRILASYEETFTTTSVFNNGTKVNSLLNVIDYQALDLTANLVGSAALFTTPTGLKPTAHDDLLLQTVVRAALVKFKCNKAAVVMLSQPRHLARYILHSHDLLTSATTNEVSAAARKLECLRDFLLEYFGEKVQTVEFWNVKMNDIFIDPDLIPNNDFKAIVLQFEDSLKSTLAQGMVNFMAKDHTRPNGRSIMKHCSKFEEDVNLSAYYATIRRNLGALIFSPMIVATKRYKNVPNSLSEYSCQKLSMIDFQTEFPTPKRVRQLTESSDNGDSSASSSVKKVSADSKSSDEEKDVMIIETNPQFSESEDQTPTPPINFLRRMYNERHEAMVRYRYGEDLIDLDHPDFDSFRVIAKLLRRTDQALEPVRAEVTQPPLDAEMLPKIKEPKVEKKFPPCKNAIYGSVYSIRGNVDECTKVECMTKFQWDDTRCYHQDDPVLPIISMRQLGNNLTCAGTSENFYLATLKIGKQKSPPKRAGKLLRRLQDLENQVLKICSIFSRKMKLRGMKTNLNRIWRD